MEIPRRNCFAVPSKKLIAIFCVFILLFKLLVLDKLCMNYNRKSEVMEHSSDERRVMENSSLKIGIVVAVDGHDTDTDFTFARHTLLCYSQLQNYALDVVYASNNELLSKICPHQDFMFKRHCFAANMLPKYDWMVFLDGDIGVINPFHRIEEYIDDSVNIIFYDRFFDWEVATGSYLAKNSKYAIDFLNKLANFEYKLPAGEHGRDNGVIHEILIEEVAPLAVTELEFCKRLLKESQDFDDLFGFEACSRLVIGANRYWPGKLKIMTKGNGWTRDGWLTETKFCSRDFMFHGWKMSKLGGEWKMPFERPEDFSNCSNGFDTWTPKLDFNSSNEEIKSVLRKKYVEVEKRFLLKVSSLADKLV